MKRILSIVLALTMILSTVAFAAPVMVGTVDTANEAAQAPVSQDESIGQDAAVYADDSDYGLLLYNIDLSSGVTFSGNKFNAKAASSVNVDTSLLPANFPYDTMVVEGEGSTLKVIEDPANAENKVLELTAINEYPSFRFTTAATVNSIPGGKFTFVYDLKAPESNKDFFKTTTATADDGTVTEVSYSDLEYAIGYTQYYYDGGSKAWYNPGTQYDAFDNLSEFTNKTGTVYGFNSEVKNNYTLTLSSKLLTIFGIRADVTTTTTPVGGETTKTTAYDKRQNVKDLKYYVDNIKLYYKPEVNVTSVDWHDLRHGYIDITLEKDVPGLTVDNVANLVSTENFFKAAAEKKVNDNGTVTYRLYHGGAFLQDKSVTLVNTYELDNYVINLYPVEKTHTYRALDMTNYDGDNMVANGDFDNPYYTTVFSGTNSAFEIKDGSIVINLNDTPSTHNNQSFKPIPLEKAKYYVEVDIQDLSKKEDFDEGYYYQSAIYMPFPKNSNEFAMTNNSGKYYTIPTHIVDAKDSLPLYSSFKVTTDLLGENTKFKFRRILDITKYTDGSVNDSAKDPIYISSFPTLPLTFQVSPKDPKGKDVSNVKGISFSIGKLSFKKMFTAHFVDGETEETLDVAKDVAFILPTTLGGEEVVQWIDEGDDKTYTAGEAYTPAYYAAEGISFTPVYKSYAPTNEKLSSVRLDEYTGVRFLASIDNTTKDAVDAYGFIVSLKTLLNGKELTHDCGVTTVQGINYSKLSGETIDKIYEIKDDTTFFTAVVHNIPQTKAAYESIFVVRPFSIVGDKYYYGEASETNMITVANSLKADTEKYEKLSTEQQEKLDAIIEMCK